MAATPPRRPRRGALCAAVACVLLAATAAQPAKPSPRPTPRRPRRDDDKDKVTLSRHSFAAPLEYRTLLEDWVVSGASLFERERLMVHPGVPGLGGFAFNKLALLTGNFEVNFQFRFTGSQDTSKLPDDQAFAFWYVKENITASYNETAVVKAPTWKEGMLAQDLDIKMAGMKRRFDGFGTVFYVHKSKSVVAALTSDGSSTVDFPRDKALPNSKEIDFRNTLNAVSFKIRVKGDKVEGSWKQSPSLSWQNVFEVKAGAKPGGFMGFSAWSGSDAASLPDLVSVSDLEVINYDDTSIGEDMKDVSAQIQEAYRDMLTDEKRHFSDQKSQTEHLGRLVTMLQDHIASTGPEQEKLFNSVQALSARLGKLGEQCRELKQETHLLLGNKLGDKKGHVATAKDLQNDIVGLRRLFQKDSKSANLKLDALTKNVQEVKNKNQAGTQGTQKLLQIAKQTEKLEQTVSSRGSQMGLMTLFLFIAIIGIGGLMYQRMHYYEKKHFL